MCINIRIVPANVDWFDSKVYFHFLSRIVSIPPNLAVPRSTSTREPVSRRGRDDCHYGRTVPPLRQWTVPPSTNEPLQQTALTSTRRLRSPPGQATKACGRLSAPAGSTKTGQVSVPRALQKMGTAPRIAHKPLIVNRFFLIRDIRISSGNET
jgi:hypothetical protein